MARVGELRPSQFITTFGPGAIMDLPEHSVIIAGLDRWNLGICEDISDPRLVRKLQVQKIRALPIPSTESRDGTLPAHLFPRYLVCPDCRRLAPAHRFYWDQSTGRIFCHNGHEHPVQVFPARFMVMCPRGHISDFPWKYYAHGSRSTDCSCEELRLYDRGSTGSIDDVQVQCLTCKAPARSLKDAFAEERRQAVLGTCFGQRPWLGQNGSERLCPETLRATLRGASNVYFPIIASALSIPPYTSPVHLAISARWEDLEELQTREELTTLLRLSLKELRDFDPDELWTAIQQQKRLPLGEDQDLLYPEWQVLTMGAQPGSQHEFETQDQPVPDRYRAVLSQLVMVRRLVEVRALTGFTRIDSLPDVITLGTDDASAGTEAIQRAPLSRERKPWLPGVLTRGEGIFVALDETEVAGWEVRAPVRERAEAMRAAFRALCRERGIPEQVAAEFPVARYTLLHTLAHALMRRLCLGSGYSSTALRERIYCRTLPGQKMAGILIYTATPDSEGSLGGLVELGESERFEGELWNALQDAAFCSGDPLCAEHQPESLGDLNGAACHACSLAAETSCERSNRFLDRSFLVPTVSSSLAAFFPS